MSNYPTLTEMGIKNPSQIVRYTCHIHNNIDHLRIVYERQPGSFLPVTRRYQFGRSSKMVVTDSGTNQQETVHEISPVLQKALKELDQVIEQNTNPNSTKQQLLQEIDRIETDMKSQINTLRAVAEKLS